MRQVKINVKNFTLAIKNALENENWYASLFIALCLPDICSKLAKPNIPTGKRYAEWFEEYVSNNYIVYDPNLGKQNKLLSGKDAYALRCAFLHQGESDIIDQKARDVLDGFRFVYPNENYIVHKNRINNYLQLQVDIFCEDMINGVDTWLENNQNASFMMRGTNFLEIESSIDNIIVKVEKP